MTAIFDTVKHTIFKEDQQRTPLAMLKLKLTGWLTRYQKYESLCTMVDKKLEAQRAEPVSLTFHFAFRKLNTEPSI